MYMFVYYYIYYINTSMCVLKYLYMNVCFRGNLLRDKGNAEAAVSSYKNAIKYRSSLAGNAFFVTYLVCAVYTVCKSITSTSHKQFFSNTVFRRMRDEGGNLDPYRFRRSFLNQHIHFKLFWNLLLRIILSHALWRHFFSHYFDHP